MFILLFLFNIFFLFLIFLSKNKDLPVITNFRISSIKTILFISGLILLFTEFLSPFNLLTFNGVASFWSFSLLVFISLFFLKYKNDLKFINFKKVFIEKNYKLILFAAFVLIVLPIIFICFYYPPNTADSMVYHLTRVEYWVQNFNIDHYPTVDARQLFHQPFGEFILLHIRLLTGNDFLFNLVQFFAMFCSVILSTLISKLFGLNYKFQILAGVLGLTIPMGIAQSTSTQTDYLAAFFLISFVYFCLDLLVKNKTKYWETVCFAAISLGLGLLTKLSVAIFAISFCIWFAIALLKKYKIKGVKIGLFFVLILFISNSPFYFRNYKLTGNLLGSPAISNMMKNDKMNLAYLTSNILRNISLHTTVHVESYNQALFNGINKIHNWMGVSVREKEITFLGDKFRTVFFMDDGSAGNFLLTFFIFLIFLYFALNFRIFFYKKQKVLFFYLLSLAVGFIAFSFVFKWQPWGSRLQLPFFVCSVPIITYFFYELCNNLAKTRFFYYLTLLVSFLFWISFIVKEKRIFFVLFVPVIIFLFFLFRKVYKNHSYINSIVLPLILLSLPYVYFNSLRPLMLNKSVMFLNNREQNYFVTLWDTEPYRQHKQLVDLVSELNIDKIAVDLRGGTWQYPIMSMLKSRVSGIEIRPLCFSKVYKNTRNFKDDFEYKVIVSDVDSSSFYTQNNIEYYELFSTKTTNGNLRLVILKQPQKLS